ncbi:glutamine--fructose-6-phosphate transaminase (isomerizing) [Zhongshania aliphaticivorans]|uniref:Glutamine--fructose-6-phosphate aminotransferase [isomerizing] n=1 Tax=Zhongshania aliphaticivorans TaxID=1470434 RepID=A0A127MAB1_9GAMM|nr:glutamine--fructose-6-phosphate transaminase (isomerizing) [Zhongshania aliphaticivorans]AMO70191.1 glutamine--fructose-6-phosphate aminotransferase [Zhongshania aliphaticivorans]
MCGIVGAVAQREVPGILLEGLRRLEYRGYDSAGMAVITGAAELDIRKEVGKVQTLADALDSAPLLGHLGIAHTRWATHGQPSEVNAHPHCSGDIALVHNGIIENHAELRERLAKLGYVFVSQTDTETVVHLMHYHYQQSGDLLTALRDTIPELDGAYGLAVIHAKEPHRLLCARKGSPLVIGMGIGENFIASDQLALRQVTDRFVYLEEGDIAEIYTDNYIIRDSDFNLVSRDITQIDTAAETTDKGLYRHYMLKEIYEQPAVIRRSLLGRLGAKRILAEAMGARAEEILKTVSSIQIVACGTSYHAGMVAKYWIEGLAGVPCRVEVASEFRYRKFKVQENTLLVTISQSGETADTLAALRLAKTLGYSASLTVCNVAQSSLVRESDLYLMTEAGPEIGVASTKAFTTQLVALLFLTVALGRHHDMTEKEENEIVSALHQLPDLLTETLALNLKIQQMSNAFADKHHALFLGRGAQWPVAMEGALKLKEISYIHAESYPAGELKHGPLALVDADMPVIAVAPNDVLLEKLKSNIEEVQARGGQLFVFCDKAAGFTAAKGMDIIELPHVNDVIAPILYTIPLQLLSYHVAILKGTDVDQPRNLAKSVTVE